MLGLLKRGAKIIMACRSELRANEALAKARQVTGEGEVEILELDLMDFTSIREFVNKVKERFPNFHCFICNAGVASRQPKTTKEDLEINIGKLSYISFSITLKVKTDFIYLKKNQERITLVISI
jgi:retinol dehydrogenase 14